MRAWSPGDDMRGSGEHESDIAGETREARTPVQRQGVGLEAKGSCPPRSIFCDLNRLCACPASCSIILWLPCHPRLSGSPSSGARGVADCDAHMSQWDALGSPREAQPCTVSGLTGAIENACPARPGSHVGTAEQGGTHSDTPSWESVSTGYHVQQWNCWVTLLNPEKQQQRP